MKVRCSFLVLAILFLAAPVDAADLVAANEARPLEKLIEELKVIAELVKQLDDPKFETRQLAGERLVRLGPSAIEPLKRVLGANPSRRQRGLCTSSRPFRKSSAATTRRVRNWEFS
jgi:hypothetical protein